MARQNRKWKAVVDGKEYELSTYMAVVNRAIEATGMSLMDLMSDDGKFQYLVQGMIFAGLEDAGVTEISGEPLTYELIGRTGDILEVTKNTIELSRTLKPETQQTGAQSKNAPAEDPEKS